MRGTKTQVRDGVYRLRVVKGYRPDGQPIQASRTVKGTERQADTALARFVTEVEQGSAAMSGAMTVAQYFDGRYMPHIRANLGPETVRNHGSRVKRIKEEIGSVRLDKLTAAHLDFAYAKWHKGDPPKVKPLLASTVRGYHLVIAAALSQAVKWQLIPRSVAPLATLPKGVQQERTPPSLDRIRSLVEATVNDDPVLSAAIMLAALTGARRGELLGLRWSDIDRSAMVLSIARSVKRAEDGSPLVGPTKTRRSRQLSIDEGTLAVLDIHRRLCEGWALDGGLTLDDGYVLTWDPSGQSPSNANMLTARFVKATKAVGCKGVRFHDLRHAVATALLSAGYDPAVVAGRLGQSPVITMRVYAHALEKRDRQAASVMGSLLASTK
jgi:integrase